MTKKTIQYCLSNLAPPNRNPLAGALLLSYYCISAFDNITLGLIAFRCNRGAKYRLFDIGFLIVGFFRSAFYRLPITFSLLASFTGS